jgi:hypothetical protein
VTLRRLALPDDDRFVRAAQFIEAALATEEVGPVRKACGMFLASAAEFYGVAVPEVRVLRVCPIRVREGDWGTELFGDYRFDEKLIRVWMRTAIQQRVISFGTFFSTLTHEFAITSTGSASGFRRRRIRAAFSSGRRCCTTMLRDAREAACLEAIRTRAIQDRLGEDESRLRRR